MASSRFRTLLRRGAQVLGLSLLLAVALVVFEGWQAFGHRATGERAGPHGAFSAVEGRAFENRNPS